MNKLLKYNFIQICRFYSTKKDYVPVIGLEIHAQIATNSKLFSGSSTVFAAPANKNVALFDAAIPGTLPVLNRICVESAIRTALALKCQINPISTFDRKHYFYADLPFGYQITQQRNPIASNGELQFQLYTPDTKQLYTKCSKLRQLQLEQDSGKSLHDLDNKKSLIDLNRAGIPLLEFVFEPDLKDGEQAAALVKELSLILQTLGVCTCKMEEGALRVDANISIHLPNTPLGPRTEIKNIGSIRGVATAISYEITRQIDLLNQNQIIINETRSWDAIIKKTLPMREKEEKQDYRFMPEPNLPPLHIQMPGISIFHTLNNQLVNVEELMDKMPILPQQKRTKLIKEYGLSIISAIILVNENILYEHFLQIMEKRKNKLNAQKVANILIMELLTIINKANVPLEQCKISSEDLYELISMLNDEHINLLTLRKVLNLLIKEKDEKINIKKLIISKNWRQITDDKEIEQICTQILSKHPEMVQKFHAGKNKVFKALLGLIANETNHCINMAKVTIHLKQLLLKQH